MLDPDCPQLVASSLFSTLAGNIAHPFTGLTPSPIPPHVSSFDQTGHPVLHPTSSSDSLSTFYPPATFQAFSLCLSISLSSAPPPGRPPDHVQPSSTPAIGGTFLKCKSDPVADLQGLLITLRIKPKLLNTANKAPGDLAPPALVSPPIYPHPTHPGPATPHTSLTSCLCLCCPLGLLSLLYIQFKHDLLQKSSLILIPSKLGRCSSALGFHRTLSLSWPLLCCILAAVSASTKMGVP